MGPASKVKIVLEKSIELEKESYGDDQRARRIQHSKLTLLIIKSITIKNYSRI